MKSARDGVRRGNASSAHFQFEPPAATVLINVAARSNAAAAVSQGRAGSRKFGSTHTTAIVPSAGPDTADVDADADDEPSVRPAPADLHPAALACHRSLLAVLCAPLVGAAAGRRRGGAGRAWQLRSRSIVQTVLVTRRRLSACVACFHT
jgi:hypothetical protein